MARIFYVHWHKVEALATVRKLRAAGHKVDFHWSTGEESWRLLKDTPPDVLVISLVRLPSHGRAVAEVIHESKWMRELPIIFVGGEPEKVAVTQKKFPNAMYCSPDELEKLLKRVRPFVPPNPAMPRTRVKTAAKSSLPTSRAPGGSAGYSGTPLPQKLGIKANHRVALLNVPTGFGRTLGDLPPDVEVTGKLVDGRTYDVIMLFSKSRDVLIKSFKPATERLDPAGGLWVSWPKKTSGVATDLTEDVVRKVGLAAGLVDNKVCAVDHTWSGLRFVIRKKDRPMVPKR